MVCVPDARNPTEQIPTRPPLFCVDVISPEDRLPRLLERVKDFHRIGVGQVWVFDPETQKVWISTAEGAEEWRGGLLRVSGPKIELDPTAAFARTVARR